MKSANFETIDGEPLVLEGVKARGRVVGRMLNMTLVQTFRNPSPTNVEVVYTFPLPWQAVLLGLEVELNGETLTGTVKAKDAARVEYEEALSEGDAGILLGVNADHSYTLELGNLMANECCVIRLHYVQVLQPEQGSLRLMLPTTLAPRYGDAVQDGGFEPHTVPAVSSTVEYPFDISLSVQGELVHAQIASPSHNLSVRAIPAVGSKEGQLIELRLAADSWLDRDLVVLFSEMQQDSLGLAAWDRLDDGSVVVMASFTPRMPPRQSLPITMKILVDCSGSMNGDSIHAARSALQGVIAGLQPTDRFSLSRFGNQVEHRSKALWKGAPAALAAARRWAETLEADMGGTEMNHAILSTLALPGSQRADLLLITDGEIYEIDAVIDSAQRSGHRFFVVGIGSSVSEGLLRRLAEDTGGSCEFVAPGEQVQPAVRRLYQRMRSIPAKQVRVAWPFNYRMRTESLLPSNIYDGDDIVVYARLKPKDHNALSHPIRLMGLIDGAGSEVVLGELTPKFVDDKENTLARLVVSQKCRQRQQSLHSLPSFFQKLILAQAEKYQLVTPDTSLILVKQRPESEKPQGMPELVKVRNMLAAGWGGLGSRTAPATRFSKAAPSVQYGMNFSESPIAYSRVPGAARQSESKATRSTKKLSKKQLNEFLDSFGSGVTHTPAPESLASSAPKQPAQTPKFWADGSAYAPDEALWRNYRGLTPAGFQEWLRLNPQYSPRSYADLKAMGLPAVVLEWLEFVVGAGQDESLVVAAFVRAAAPKQRASLELKETQVPQLAAALKGLTQARWPAAVVDFAEGV